MEKVYKFLLTFLISLGFVFSVQAEECSNEDLERLTEFANNVQVSASTYTEDTINYDDIFESNETISVMKGYITVTNLTDELYGTLVNSSGETITFTKDDEVSGLLNLLTGVASTVKKYTISIYASSCDTLLRTIDVVVPRYNPFQTYAECADIPEFYYCSSSITLENLSDADFRIAVEKYKNGEVDQEGEDVSDTPKVTVWLILEITLVVLVFAGIGTGLYLYEKNKAERSNF